MPTHLDKTPPRATSLRSSYNTRSSSDTESRRALFEKENDNGGRVASIIRRRNSKDVDGKAAEPPTASLLKYEVRKLVDLRRVSETFGGSIIINTKDTNNNNSNNSNKFEKPSLRKTLLPSNKRDLRQTKTVNGGDTMSNKCSFCEELQDRLKSMEDDFNQERKANEAKFLQFEKQLEQSLKERDDFSKTIKKLQREIKKLEQNLDEEKVQTRRLGIKLEDANYEIGRLRQELINSQLENETIVEENEDLAVDNEDLIKERDEIVQIYDELFRESERLKMEVKIWKQVFENNKENLPEMTEEEKKGAEGTEEAESTDEDEGVDMDMEEDISLLLPPRDDIIMKNMEPSKVFDIAEELGRGKFGKVYRVVSKSTGDAYAAKYVKVTSKLRQDVLNTIEVMKKIHHVRLMNIFDVYDLGAQIIVILEYVGGGMLFERIVEKNSLCEADCTFYMKQILQGLYHIHRQNICHLEIKPENIVCVSRTSMDIKLIDFGLARQLEHKKDIKITAGSPEFVAPEILSFDPVSLGSDMWSIGVLTYVLLSGLSPFIGDDDNDTLLNVSCGEYEFDETAFKKISKCAKEFIEALLVSSPKKRMTAAACLNHPWMKATVETKRTKIDLENMKKFLEKRKHKQNVSGVRAIRRFSSFGVGALNGPRTTPMSRGGSSRHLAVPNALQASSIAEDEEQEEEGDQIINVPNCNGPTVTITSDDAPPPRRNRRSRIESTEMAPPEDTDTPDGLRQYLQRMISEGHLPGGGGPPEIDASDDET